MTKTTLFCLLLAGFSLGAIAAEVTEPMSWENPDKNRDGSTLTDLVQINIYYAIRPGDFDLENYAAFPAVGLEGQEQSGDVQFTIPDGPGPVFVDFQARAVDSVGHLSAPSPETIQRRYEFDEIEKTVFPRRPHMTEPAGDPGVCVTSSPRIECRVVVAP